MSTSYSERQIAMLHKLWYRFLIKENNLLTLKDFETCFQCTPVSEIFELLNDLFRLEESKDQRPFRLGTKDLVKVRIKCNKYFWYPGIFYGSNVFGDLLCIETPLFVSARIIRKLSEKDAG
jgi:hypothetical protein